MTTILANTFDTKLGTIRTWLETDNDASVLQQDNCEAVTKGHRTFIQPFELNDIVLPEDIKCESLKGWRWFVQKTSEQNEQLTIFCNLINPTTDLTYDSDSGEHLDAIEIKDGTYQLHIGTEDGETMQYRARESDWMPKRLENEIGLLKSFTEYIDFGFKTTIPDLKKGEKIYFHFIVATNPIRQSIESLDHQDISTWLVVDRSKRFLDDKLKNTAGNISLLL